jgi:quercetin dioxygenase-like cupin family protein
MNIKSILLPSFIAVVVSITGCSENKKQEEMTTQNNVSIFPKGNKLPNDNFTGNAFLHPMAAKDSNNEFALGCVTFEPGARTIWHTHPKGQVLIVTEGEGFNQEKGKPAQVLKKGDVVNIPANTEHWHGASLNSKLVHIAITNYKGDENVVWLQPVTDEEYNQVNKNKIKHNEK